MKSVGPYVLPRNGEYKKGDKLYFNQYAWNKVANMLFIDTPAIVGFSTDKVQDGVVYKDLDNAKNLFAALKGLSV